MAITYASGGNLLEADVDALVNAVNEVGVMGKGLALQFRAAFPASAGDYSAACARREVSVGRVFVTRSGQEQGPAWIIHFPTKKHWRDPSRIEWVRDGLQDLVRVVRQHSIRSVALPALGCGLGGLGWSDVRSLIEEALHDLPGVEVLVFEPQPVSPVSARQRKT